MASTGQAERAPRIDFDALLAPYRSAAEAAPRDYTAHLNLGCAYASLDALDKAAESFRQALSLAPHVPETHYFLGRVYGLERLHDKSAEVFQSAVELFPQWGQAHAQLGIARFFTHDYVRAERELRRAIERMGTGTDPTIQVRGFPGVEPGAAILEPLPLGEVRTYLGRALFGMGRVDDAAAMYERAVHSGTPLPATYVLLGSVYMQQRQFDKAEEAFQAAVRQDPRMSRAHYQLGLLYARRGDEAAAAAEMETFHALGRQLSLDTDVEDALGGPAKAKALSNVGWDRLEQGLYAEAVGYFEWALWHDNKLAEAHSGYGYAYTMQDRLEEAQSAFDEALRLDPQLASAEHGVGLLWMKRAESSGDRGAYEQAYGAFRKAVALDKTSVDALQNLGMAAQELGKLEESRAAFEGVLALDPERKATRVRLAAVLLELGESRAAAEQFGEVLAKDPEYVDAHYALGIAAIARRRFDIATEELETVVRLEPKHGLAHFHLGRSYAETRKFTEAERAFRGAIDLIPEYAPAYAELAHMYGVQREHLGEAVELARKAAALSPDSREAHNTLSWVCYLSEEYDAAEAAIRRAIELAPDNQTYRDGLATIQKAREEASGK